MFEFDPVVPSLGQWEFQGDFAGKPPIWGRVKRPLKSRSKGLLDFVQIFQLFWAGGHS